MRILKVAVTVLALAAPLASAHAEEAKADPATTSGWNGQWALLFQLNNILANSQVLGDFAQLGIGGEYFLAPNMAARVGVSYGRTTNPVEVSKNVDETAGSQVVTYTLSGTGGNTSTSAFDARADLLYRLTSSAVAPYVGAGLFFDWRQGSTDYTDDVTTVNQVTTVHNFDRTWGLGLRGVLGAEWRLHPSFSIFAEYALSVTVLEQHSTQDSTATEVTLNGDKSVHHVSSESGRMRWLAADTALTHGGQVGLAVHF